MGVQGREGPGGYQGNISLEAMKQVAAQEKQELSAELLASQRAFKDQMEEAVNPFAAKFATKQKDIRTRATAKTEKAKEATKDQRLLPPEAIKDAASRFQQQTRGELPSKMLLLLREYIKNDDSPQQILEKLQEVFAGKDPAVLDEALSFLEETTQGELREKIKSAREELQKTYKREIMAGRNIAAASRQAADEGVGSPENMRGMYQDITGNPRDVNTLFDELAAKYPYGQLRNVIKFLLSSLGADLRSNGPSIERGLLHRLLTEARSLQAILGVYSFFKGRMPLMKKMFNRQGVPLPQNLGFEAMAKQFMALVNDRYPSEQKVLQTTQRLGIDKWLRAKIIVLSQLRDAIREVAKERIYRSMTDRDKLYDAIILALENLEDELQELEELEEEGTAACPELTVTSDKMQARPGETITFTAKVSGGTPPYTIYWQWADDKDWKVGDKVYARPMPTTRANQIPMMVIIRDSKEMGSKTAILQIKVLT